MTSFKLVWLPGPGHYRLKVFAGVDAEHRALAGELTLRPGEAIELRQLFNIEALSLVSVVDEAGWVAPELEATST